MKNLDKLKNPPDQFKNFSIKHDMTVDERKNERMLQDIANEKKKTLHQNKDSKNFVFVARGPLWDSKVIKLKRKINQDPLATKDMVYQLRCF